MPAVAAAEVHQRVERLVAGRRPRVVTSIIMHVLSPGSTLGRFNLIALVGKGGMGEVWRAQDSRLNREVAIKVLPPEMENPELRIRFDRECKILAALNHPNIAQIYEAGEEQVTSDAFPGRQTTVSFLVMEFVVGKSLMEMLESGPLPFLAAVRLGRQIGKALVVAHRAGIIHRDLKPANIMVTQSGQVKVLDFGLARPLSASSVGGATLPELTISGMVVGTAAYLAPEQVRGEPASIRSDVWSLGCVLYQMLAGARPFPGQTIPETLASILRDEPLPLAQVNPAVPPALRTVVEKCLDKDPERRPEDAQEVVNLLKDLIHGAREARRATVSDADGTPAISFDAIHIEAVNRCLKAIDPASPQISGGRPGSRFVEIQYRGKKTAVVLGTRPDSVDPLLALVTPVCRFPASNLNTFYRRILSLNNSSADLAHCSIDRTARLVNLVCVRPCDYVNPQQLRHMLDVTWQTACDLGDLLRKEFGV
jgi:serine/threonine protein kinase